MLGSRTQWLLNFISLPSCFPSDWTWASTGSWGYSSKVQDLVVSLVELHKLPAAQFSSLFRSLWTAAQPSAVSTTPPSSMPSANLLRVHSVPSSRSLMKRLQYWLQYQPLEYTTSDLFAAGLCVSDHYYLLPSIQVFPIYRTVHSSNTYPHPHERLEMSFYMCYNWRPCSSLQPT